MLAGMLLHVIESPRPINPTLHAGLVYRFFKQVDNPLVLVFNNIDDGNII
jgi:hypothetical protein